MPVWTVLITSHSGLAPGRDKISRPRDRDTVTTGWSTVVCKVVVPRLDWWNIVIFAAQLFFVVCLLPHLCPRSDTQPRVPPHDQQRLRPMVGTGSPPSQCAWREESFKRWSQCTILGSMSSRKWCCSP